MELAPSEIKKVEVEVRDVWNIRKRTLSEFKGRTETLMQKLRRPIITPRPRKSPTAYTSTLDDIEKSQGDQTVSPAPAYWDLPPESPFAGQD